MGRRLKNLWKWLHPGIGIKRWMGLSLVAVVLVIFGSSTLQTEQWWIFKALDLLIIICGLVILALSVKNMIRSFVSAFMPTGRDVQLVDILYRRRELSMGRKVVAIGGGTGLSVLLSGLKEYSFNICAIVTVADDGGSSGRLRQEFDILPPGDIRNCLVALADAPALLRELFQFRFGKDTELAGHSFGNLFITAMTQVTGDFEKAIKETSKVLALRGKVIPSTLEKVVLVAEYTDGSQKEGEDSIPKVGKPIRNVLLKPSAPSASMDAIKAIREAEIIVLGPGSLYTSIIPNLLVKEISEAVAESSAIKIYVCNIMTQAGETDGFSASDHVKTLIRHSHPRVITHCIINVGQIPEDILEHYRRQNSYPVMPDRRNIERLGYRVIEDDVVVVDNLVRHNAQRLAQIIFGLTEEEF